MGIKAFFKNFVIYSAPTDCIVREIQSRATNEEKNERKRDIKKHFNCFRFKYF